VLVEALAALVTPHRNMVLLDLCCGTGTLGLCLASRVGQVLGLDSLASAIEEAQRNASANHLSNASYLVGGVEEALARLLQAARPGMEVVAVVDPPRTGLTEKAVQQLRSSPLRKLVVVSSDPKAALRNFVDLGRAASSALPGDPFMLSSIQPVDLFPHTTHFMTLMLLARVPQSELSGSPASSSLFPAYGASGAKNTYPGRVPAPQAAPAPVTPVWKGGAPVQGPQAVQGERRWLGEGAGGAVEEEELTGGDQQRWLAQMEQQHGKAFQKAEWVAKFRSENQGKARPPAPKASKWDRPPAPSAAPPAPARPPSPAIPPMPPFPVAPTSKDPREYAKYKAEYDAYSDWYNKWGEQYAAREERKKTVSQGREMPDPNKVPPGTDPAAWRKYCQDTVDYWRMYDAAK